MSLSEDCRQAPEILDLNFRNVEDSGGAPQRTQQIIPHVSKMLRFVENKTGDPERRQQNIPFIISQIFVSSDGYTDATPRQVPERMWQNIQKWKDMNSEYDYQLLTDDDVRDYVEACDFSKLGVSRADFMAAYRKLIPASGKADILRYLVMCEQGGCYFDIDTEPLEPLRQLIRPDDDMLSGIGTMNDIHQFALIYIPSHRVMQQALQGAVRNVLAESCVGSQRKNLPTICGPPLLDIVYRNIFGLARDKDLKPGIYDENQTRVRIIGGDLLGGALRFKYDGYHDDLKILGRPYWLDQPICASEVGVSEWSSSDLFTRSRGDTQQPGLMRVAVPALLVLVAVSAWAFHRKRLMQTRQLVPWNS